MILIYLIKNGEFTNGTYLFWDEPEVNLNPSLSKAIVELLIFLTKEFNTQIFIATHDYFIIKYFDILNQKYKNTTNSFNLKYFSFYITDKNLLEIETANDLYNLKHNAIIEEFEEVYNNEIEILKEVI
jgi:ABC-type multidrug transport system ATPase subunit